MRSIVFYRRDAASNAQSGSSTEEELSISFWQPARDGPPRGLFANHVNHTWWLLSKLGLFATRDFTVLAIHHRERLLHRLAISPRWYRFPDMGPGDLQIGMLWTAPECRGQGLARMAITEVHRRFAGRYEWMWYLADEDNLPSRRLIETIGYPQVAHGVRTAPFGIKPLGRFTIEHWCCPAQIA